MRSYTVVMVHYLYVVVVEIRLFVDPQFHTGHGEMINVLAGQVEAVTTGAFLLDTLVGHCNGKNN